MNAAIAKPRNTGNAGKGRPKGSKNKATIAREAQAAALTRHPDGSRRELAVEALERAMKIAEGVTSTHRAISAEQAAALSLAEGRQIAPQTGNAVLFGEWFDRWTFCIKELAKYQSAPIKSVDLPAPPPDPKQVEAGKVRRFGLRVFEGGRSVREEMPDAESA